jgi:hypothetical protein
MAACPCCERYVPDDAARCSDCGWKRPGARVRDTGKALKVSGKISRAEWDAIPTCDQCKDTGWVSELRDDYLGERGYQVARHCRSCYRGIYLHDRAKDRAQNMQAMDDLV